MATTTTRIKDIPTTATTAAPDDYFVIDGATNGTRKYDHNGDAAAHGGLIPKWASKAIADTYVAHPRPPTITASVLAGGLAPTLIASGVDFAMDAQSTYFRVYGCAGLQSEGGFFGATAWRSSTPLSDNPTLWTPWNVEWVSSASQVEVVWSMIAYGTEFRLLVDDYVIVNTAQPDNNLRDSCYLPTSFAYATASGNFRLLLDWSGKEAPRKYRMEFWSNSRFILVRVPTGKTVVKPADDKRRRVLFFGDSWTEVGGANRVWNNWAAQVSRALRVDGILSGCGGCGYKNASGAGRLNGLDRLATDTVGLSEPDYVVVAYGLNDVTFQWGNAEKIAATKANIAAFFHTLSAIFPNSKVIVFGAFNPANETQAFTDFDAYLQSVCVQYGHSFIDTSSAGSFLGSAVSIAPYLADASHLTPYGHSELAAWAYSRLYAHIK